MGLLQNATNAVQVDQLIYHYFSGSNKLQYVEDGANNNTPAAGVLGYLGDFHYANGSGTVQQHTDMMLTGI